MKEKMNENRKEAILNNSDLFIDKWCYIDDLFTSKEPVSEELEEAAMQYGTDKFPSLCNGCKHVPVDTFKAGAQWQKERMLKMAFDGKISFGQIILSKIIPTNLAKDGDKVKVFIIKKD